MTVGIRIVAALSERVNYAIEILCCDQNDGGIRIVAALSERVNYVIEILRCAQNDRGYQDAEYIG